MKPSIASQEFRVKGRLVTVTPTGNGNINDTYLAIFRTTFSEERFIVQKLNRHVFKSPEAVMHNMKAITEHVHARLEQEGDASDRIWQLPRIIPTRSGRDFLLDEEGHCWRAISLIASARAFDTVQSPEHAHEVGVVLGNFQRLISDFPCDALQDTLPGFHVTPAYLAQYDRAAAEPAGQQRLRVSAESRYCEQFVAQRRHRVDLLEQAHASGAIPLRPVHGDAKVTNIMIDDATGKGTCIIDLDTVKPGFIHYDFGDCLRSCCNLAGEETLDLGPVCFDTDICASLVKGYMAYARRFMTPGESALLFESIWLLTFELGLRFFADHIAGNRYFKVRHDEHNLHRARVQFRLCESIETREPLIRRILEQYA